MRIVGGGSALDIAAGDGRILHPVLLGPPLMPRIVPSPTILVFDSGLGGLTVFAETMKARPDARYVYAADDTLFPYGRLSDDALISRVTDVIGEFVEAHRPDLVVIACNTASTVALPALRQRFSVPFVGTVPAIKPACAASRTKHVSVLGTEATVRREYTRELIRSFADGCEMTLVGSARLAMLAEAHLTGAPADDAAIREEIAPCFVGDADRRTDTVVLACTHYPLLLDRLTALAPWPVCWIDPAPAIARRVVELVGGPSERSAPAAVRAVFTSGCEFPLGLAAALKRFGIAEIVHAD